MKYFVISVEPYCASVLDDGQIETVRELGK